MNGRCLCIAAALASGWLAGPAAGDDWLGAGRKAVAAAAAEQIVPGPARNAILFLGDGMGITTVTAARILEGQRRGESGEGNALAWEGFPYTAFSKVYTTDDQTPESAGTMTAIVTGAKTRSAVLSVDETVGRGDFAAVAGHQLTTILEQAEQRGLATGIVTTTTVTHATPGATYAHSPDRDWEDDSQAAAGRARGRLPGHRAPAARASARRRSRGRAGRRARELPAGSGGRSRVPGPEGRPARRPGSDGGVEPSPAALGLRLEPGAARRRGSGGDGSSARPLRARLHAIRSRSPARRRGRALAVADDREGDRPARAPLRRLLPDGRGRPHRSRPSRRQRLSGARRDDRALGRRARRAREDGSEADADRRDRGSRSRLHVRRLREARQRHPRQGLSVGRPQGRYDRKARARRDGPPLHRFSVTRTAPATPAPRPSSRKGRSTFRIAPPPTVRRPRADPTSARSTPPPPAIYRSPPCPWAERRTRAKTCPSTRPVPARSSSAACASRTISTTRWSKHSGGTQAKRAASRRRAEFD